MTGDEIRLAATIIGLMLACFALGLAAAVIWMQR